VSSASNSSREWLIDVLPSSLAHAFEAMAGARPEVRVEDGVPPVQGALIRRQGFNGLEGALWLAAAEPDWTAAGNEVLRAAGIDDGDAATLKSTYFETIGQALSSLASSVTSRLQREVTCDQGQEGALPPAGLAWTLLRLTFGATKVQISIGFDQELLEHLVPDAPLLEPARDVSDQLSAHPDSASRTFDLLLDVELPVSVSFGRAQVQLKDLIKLTTGSIVELNRSISEPVEVIVNNCVIARGEVVVVEGNFGVRIQQVVSRQERLRTLT
jgi:flagellar motor switch protein FliN